jgi:hypothetical protein
MAGSTIALSAKNTLMDTCTAQHGIKKGEALSENDEAGKRKTTAEQRSSQNILDT